MSIDWKTGVYITMRRNKEKARRGLFTVFKECARFMWPALLLDTAANILSGVLGVTTANALGEYTDAALHLDLSLGGKQTLILITCVLLTVCVVPALGMLSSFSMLKNALKHDSYVIGRFLDQTPEDASRFNVGELQYELEDAPNTLRIQWVTLCGKVLAMPICLSYLMYCTGNISILLACLLLILSAAKVSVPLLFKSKLAKYDKAERAYHAQRRSEETEITEKSYIIKLWGLQEPFINRVQQLFENHYKENRKKGITVHVVAEQLNHFISNTSYVLLLFVGALMIARNRITPGEFAAMTVYYSVAQTIWKDVGEIVQKYPIMQNAANTVCRLCGGGEDCSEKHIEAFKGLKAEELSVTFENCSVFNHLCFSIDAGEKIGIVGKNGSGKSTLSRVLCGLLKNYGGTVKINGNDLRRIHSDDWRRLIAYAPQNPFLFNATVRENITFSNPFVDKEEAERLMSEFGILSLADREITAKTELSGGEKQKISLIRALLKPSSVIILDEPSNHLDIQSIDALKRIIYHTEKTVIMITHDSSFLSLVHRQIII